MGSLLQPGSGFRCYRVNINTRSSSDIDLFKTEPGADGEAQTIISGHERSAKQLAASRGDTKRPTCLAALKRLK